MLRAILFVLLLPSICLAQIDLFEATKSKAVSGLTDPQLIAGRILVGPDSKPAIAEVAIVRVVTAAKFVRVKARKSIFESVELAKIDEQRWLLEGVGRYSVEVTTFDPDTGIDGAQIEVVLGEPTKPDDPTKPPDNPPPSGTFDDIKAVSASGCIALNDQMTAGKLAVSLRAVVPSVRFSADLPSAQASVVNTIENTLLTRMGASRTKDWLGLWRRPLNTAIEAAKQSGRIKTPADYAAVIEAMAAGLQPTGAN